MPNERKGSEEQLNRPPTPALARLLEAEKKADEIAERAQSEAAQIVAAAKLHAKQILEAAGASETDAAGSPQARAEVETEERLILEDANWRIEAMKAAAAARAAQAVEKLMALLVAES